MVHISHYLCLNSLADERRVSEELDSNVSDENNLDRGDDEGRTSTSKESSERGLSENREKTLNFLCCRFAAEKFRFRCGKQRFETNIDSQILLSSTEGIMIS